MKRSILYGFMMAAFALLFSIQQGNAQSRDEKQEKKEAKAKQIAELIQNKHFTFVAQSALPMGGRLINLTSQYNLRVKGDTTVSDLPYFGRAFVAPMNPTESALHFTTTKFDFTANENKKGMWEVEIKPKDQMDVRQMFLTISDDGYASLRVQSNDRQAITFDGYVTSKERI